MIATANEIALTESIKMEKSEKIREKLENQGISSSLIKILFFSWKITKLHYKGFRFRFISASPN